MRAWVRVPPRLRKARPVYKKGGNMDSYIIALMLIQWGIFTVAKIYKIENKILPEMIMILTLIMVFK